MREYIYDLPPSSEYKVTTARRPRRKRIPDGVIYKMEYYHAVYFTGTAETLIAAGLVEEHMLPGQPGRNKTIQRFPPIDDNYKEGMRIARMSNSTFQVGFPFSIREQEQSHAAALAEREAELRAAESKANAVNARKGLSMALNIARRYLDGYCCDESTLAEFECLAEEMEDLLREDKPQNTVPADRIAAAKGNPQLQAFLQAAVRNLSLVEGKRQEGV